MQWASARPYTPRQGTDYFGVGNSSTLDYAAALNSDSANLTATKAYTAAQIRACLAAGNCTIRSYGSLRGQPFYQLDTRFSKTFKIGEKVGLEFIFQAFDLTNRANFGANFQSNIRSSSFGKPTAFFTPSSVVVPQFFSGEAGFTLRF